MTLSAIRFWVFVLSGVPPALVRGLIAEEDEDEDDAVGLKMGSSILTFRARQDANAPEASLEATACPLVVCLEYM